MVKKILPSLFSLFFGLALIFGNTLFFFTGCASYDQRLNNPSISYLGTNGSLTHQQRGAYTDRACYWDGDGSTGAASIVIDLSDQRLYYYKGGRLVGVSSVSTGSEGRETKAGHYKICQKDLHHVSSQFGNYITPENEIIKDISSKDPKPPGSRFIGAPMPYFMRIYNGVGMHAGFLPGVADSHGCIRLPENMAKIFFEVTPMGTPVTIQK